MKAKPKCLEQLAKEQRLSPVLQTLTCSAWLGTPALLLPTPGLCFPPRTARRCAWGQCVPHTVTVLPSCLHSMPSPEEWLCKRGVKVQCRASIPNVLGSYLLLVPGYPPPLVALRCFCLHCDATSLASPKNKAALPMHSGVSPLRNSALQCRFINKKSQRHVQPCAITSVSVTMTRDGVFVAPLGISLLQPSLERRAEVCAQRPDGVLVQGVAL